MNLRNLFLEVTPTGTRKVYVSTTGSDANDGSEASPFLSINQALASAQPGDMILVSSGTYGYTQAANKTATRYEWISILPVDENADVKVTVSGTTDNFFNIISSCYIGIFGLEVYSTQENANTNGSGISIYGNSHHIRVWNCHIHDFPGGGINCFDVGGSHDMLDLSFNTIHGTSKYSSSNTSGISIYAPRDLTNGAVWLGGYAYRIVGNYIYDVECTVPFTPGGYDMITDGNGVSLDLIYDTYSYTKPILVESNIIVGCGARAVHAYGTVNVDMLYNTAIGNLRTDSPAINGDPELDSEQGSVSQTTAQAASVRIIGNVILPLNTPNWQDARSTYQDNIVLGGSQTVTTGSSNIDKTSVGFSYFDGPLDQPSLLTTQPLTSFIPAQLDRVTRISSITGWQVLGNGPRSMESVGAGAIE